MSEAQTAKPEVYRVSLGRRIALMVVFALMLPFFFSMPVMTAMRAMHGNLIDASAIAIAAIIFAISLYYLALQIQAAQKTRIEIHDDAARIVAPDWRGMFPKGPYTDKKVPFSDIQSVEERGELYRVMGVVGLPRVSSVITKNGERLVLGAVNENEVDPAIHYGAVAQKIAEKANLTVADKGVVDAGTQMHVLMKGSPSWDKAPIPQARVDAMRERGHIMHRGLVILFLALAAFGLILLLVPGVADSIGGLLKTSG